MKSSSGNQYFWHLELFQETKLHHKNRHHPKDQNEPVLCYYTIQDVYPEILYLFDREGKMDGLSLQLYAPLNPKIFLGSVIKNISFPHRNINLKAPPIQLHYSLTGILKFESARKSQILMRSYCPPRKHWNRVTKYRFEFITRNARGIEIKIKVIEHKLLLNRGGHGGYYSKSDWIIYLTYINHIYTFFFYNSWLKQTYPFKLC